MPIELRDIRDAVKAYMDTKITVWISEMPNVPNETKIDAGQNFRFTISAQNAPDANRAVSIKNMKYCHINRSCCWSVRNSKNCTTVCPHSWSSCR